ncbi:MAG: hypothetical protein JXR58_10980 [Bacteroidales bacterium]|nr:hypothetical protein [Bacteroidales bacterium]
MKIKTAIISILISFSALAQEFSFEDEDFSHQVFAGSKFFMDEDYFRAFSAGYGYTKGNFTLGGEFEFYDQMGNNAWFAGLFLKAVPLKWGRVGLFFQTGVQYPITKETKVYDFVNVNIMAGIKRFSLISNNPAAIEASVGYDFRFINGQTKYVLFPKLSTVFFF